MPPNIFQTIHSSFETKKKSSWDFEHISDTVDDYWVDPDKNLCPESTQTRWHCYHFFKKRSKSNFDTTLRVQKPFIPKFCGRNFSRMHHFEDMNVFFPLDSCSYYRDKNKYKGSSGDKIVISSKWCFQEKIQPQNLEVTKGFIYNQSGVKIWFLPISGKMIAAPAGWSTLWVKTLIWATSVIIHNV